MLNSLVPREPAHYHRRTTELQRDLDWKWRIGVPWRMLGRFPLILNVGTARYYASCKTWSLESLIELKKKDHRKPEPGRPRYPTITHVVSRNRKNGHRTKSNYSTMSSPKMNKTSPSPVASPIKQPKGFLSLPSELRHQILEYTYAVCKDLRIPYSGGYTVRSWSQIIGQVDARLHEDIQLVGHKAAKALLASTHQSEQYSAVKVEIMGRLTRYSLS